MIPKRKKDIPAIDDRIISMYARRMAVRQISETIGDIYGFEVSEGMVSDITRKSRNGRTAALGCLPGRIHRRCAFLRQGRWRHPEAGGLCGSGDQ